MDFSSSFRLFLPNLKRCKIYFPKFPWTFFVLIVFLVHLKAQDTIKPAHLSCRILFWNTENFFDPFDDSLTSDEEFTPMGDRHWTMEKYRAKRNAIFKLIAAAGNPEPPCLIGLAEIENRKAVNELVFNTPLVKYPYGIIQRESPDPRGIDAVILYRKDCFRLLASRFIQIEPGKVDAFRSREIVYAKGMVDQDTLHFFVNHWPSRSGGQAASDSRRCAAALTLKKITDSILQKNPAAHIIITGDFNDTPSDASLSECLAAKFHNDNTQGDGKTLLVNLSGIIENKDPEMGTHKFQGDWAMLDQFIVSSSLLSGSKFLWSKENKRLEWSIDGSGKRKTPLTTVKSLQIFTPAFLLEKDDQFLGVKPFRTFNGMRYQGGYSDHLPVILQLE